MSRKWAKGDLSGEKGYRVCYYAPGREFKVDPPLNKPPHRTMLLAKTQAEIVAESGGNSDICVLDNRTFQFRSPKPLNQRHLLRY